MKDFKQKMFLSLLSDITCIHARTYTLLSQVISNTTNNITNVLVKVHDILKIIQDNRTQLSPLH